MVEVASEFRAVLESRYFIVELARSGVAQRRRCSHVRPHACFALTKRGVLTFR